MDLPRLPEDDPNATIAALTARAWELEMAVKHMGDNKAQAYAVSKAYVAVRAKQEAAEAALYAANVQLEAITQIMHQTFGKTRRSEEQDHSYSAMGQRQRDCQRTIAWRRS